MKNDRIEPRDGPDQSTLTPLGTPIAPAPPIPPTGNESIDAQVSALVERWGADHSPELVAEMIGTILKMARDRMSVADLKLFNRALKEMRRAARMWVPYKDVPKISVFGSARTTPDQIEYQIAENFARRMREEGFMVITGGGEGIMGAAQKGAGRERSFGLNIRLPFEQQANETIIGDPKLVEFNYFFTRKLNFVKESHAIALFPGGFGTMDEGFETLTLLQTGKSKIIPLVLVDKPGGDYWQTWDKFMRENLMKAGLISDEDFAFFRIANDIETAVEEVLHFYRVYHSSRYVGDRFVIRLKARLSVPAIDALNTNFADLLQEGEFEQGGALRQERGEPEVFHLPRLIFTLRRRSFARLRMLIDAINDSPTERRPGMAVAVGEQTDSPR
jgi:uncharacterized protein (TIGR00730 family)